MPEEYVIHNDHESLKYSKEQEKLNKRHAKWVEILKQFAHVTKYRKGKTNITRKKLFRDQYLATK